MVLFVLFIGFYCWEGKNGKVEVYFFGVLWKLSLDWSDLGILS